MVVNFSKFGFNLAKQRAMLAVLLGMVGLTACHKQPPTERPPVALPVYSQGDATLGKTAYEKQCKQCHSLEVGSNNKGHNSHEFMGQKWHY